MRDIQVFESTGSPSNADRMRAMFKDNPLLLGPMAGWTDAIFRGICKSFGAGLTCTEMISAMGIHYRDKKTLEYLELADSEDIAAVQLFGNNPDIMAQAAVFVAERLGDRLAAVDINMGCPARKVVRKGEGSALMETPELASRIISRVVDAVDLPVTVKFRRGFKRGRENAVEFAKMTEASGASAICVHGRYAEDLYHGKADWDLIARVVDAVSIPVVASGDMMDPVSVKRCLDVTDASAAMIARGAQGNPWIFARTKKYLDTCRGILGSESVLESVSGSGLRVPAQVTSRVSAQVSDDTLQALSQVPLQESSRLSAQVPDNTSQLPSQVLAQVPDEPDATERLRVARIHMRLLADRGGRHLVKLRTCLPAYLKALPGASAARRQIMLCKSKQDYEELFDLLALRLSSFEPEQLAIHKG